MKIDLNNMGSGKKLIDMLIKGNNIQTMGWTKQQQQELINKQKNSKPSK